MRHFKEMKIGGECGREVVTPLVTSVNLWKDNKKNQNFGTEERNYLKDRDSRHLRMSY